MRYHERQLHQLIQNELSGDEQILWQAQPQGNLFSPITFILSLCPAPIFLLLFSIMFLSLFTAAALNNWGGSIQASAAYVFIGVAGYFALCFAFYYIGSTIAVRSQAKYTRHVITNQKAFIISNGIYKAVHRFFPHDITDPEQWITDDKIGALYFAYITPNSLQCDNGFRGIRNTETVKSLLKQLKASE